MIRTRQITKDDLGRMADLLASGFQGRSRMEWLKCLNLMTSHNPPDGFPKYGYILEHGKIAVGVLLLISSIIRPGINRCNVSSWYVEPAYRCYAPLLGKHAIRLPNATYLNVSPAKHTLPIIEAQGFTRYSTGQFAAIPLSGRRTPDRVKVLGVDARSELNCESWESDLLIQHARFGCFSVRCVTFQRDYPFVFRPRMVRGLLPCVQLVYCREIEEFRRFSVPLGKFFALRGRPMILVDANGPIGGISGKYFEGVSPKFFKGPSEPHLGDLAYTEIAMFGM